MVDFNQKLDKIYKVNTIKLVIDDIVNNLEFCEYLIPDKYLETYLKTKKDQSVFEHISQCSYCRQRYTLLFWLFEFFKSRDQHFEKVHNLTYQIKYALNILKKFDHRTKKITGSL